jgi:hypothetical protein
MRSDIGSAHATRPQEPVRSTTRGVLEGAAMALQNELELQSERVNR